MSGKRCKFLRKVARLTSKPYRDLKRDWKESNHLQRGEYYAALSAVIAAHEAAK